LNDENRPTWKDVLLGDGPRFRVPLPRRGSGKWREHAWFRQLGRAIGGLYWPDGQHSACIGQNHARDRSIKIAFSCSLMDENTALFS